jgi:hypothetical protein
MQHAGKAEQMISMKMANEDPHLSVRTCSCLQELSLCAFTTVEKK